MTADPVGVQCSECGVIFAGTRSEARRVQWEAYSNRTQRDLDHGPMWCPTCIDKLLTRSLAEFRRGIVRGIL